MTCVMRVLGSLPDAHASMRAWRFEPLPDMRTVRLCCEPDIFEEYETGRRENYCIVWGLQRAELPRPGIQKVLECGVSLGTPRHTVMAAKK
jgi:hypothetical protein